MQVVLAMSGTITGSTQSAIHKKSSVHQPSKSSLTNWALQITCRQVIEARALPHKIASKYLQMSLKKH